MPLTLQEMSDRFEIMDVLTNYCTAIDNKKIDALDFIFTSDARIDYSRAGGPITDLRTIKKFLEKNLGDLPRQHMVSNYQIRIQGDQAYVRCLCHNPLEIPPEQGALPEIMLWGLWYEDKFLRTPEGWRIKERVTKPCYSWKIERK